MTSRFKDLTPKKPNMFRKKSNSQRSNKPTLKENSRWSTLETDKKVENKFKDSPKQQQNSRWSTLDTDQKQENKFKSESKLQQNSRWGNLESEEINDRNSFKYRKPQGRFNREKNGYRNNRNYRGRRPRDNSPGIFTGAKMINGVPQIKGGVQKSFNILDTFAIKKPPKKKSPKKKKKKQTNIEQLEKLIEPEETEEEKRQKELWKQQLIAQYAYEYDTEEEEDDGDIDENTD